MAAAAAAVPGAVPPAVPAIAAAGAGPPDDLAQALMWIGFNAAAQRDAIHDELMDLQSLSEVTHKEIRDLRDSYASRRIQDGRIIFGMQRTKKLMAMTDWVRDCQRLNEVPDINGMNANSFNEELLMSAERQTVRASEKDTMETRAKESTPGMLTGESIWDKWEAKLTNYLSILYGANGVPLAYIIRELEEPADDAEYENFTEESIARCPLEGPRFESDTRRVHQIISSFTTGENAEQWIKPIARRQNGREDMATLRAHYRGEGNQTRRIGTAESLRDTLHYKSEGAMPFASFLSKCQKMFNLFEQTGEPYGEPAKLRFLFDKVQNAELRPAVEALKNSISINPDSHTFSSAANHLAAQVKPRATRQINAVGADTTGNQDKSIIRNGKIFTGYYPNWSSLSKESKQAVIAERERTGTQKKGGSGGSNKIKKLEAEVKKWQSTSDKQKATIKALKRNHTDETEESSGDEQDDDAGNSFGGRREKSKKKQKKPKGN